MSLFYKTRLFFPATMLLDRICGRYTPAMEPGIQPGGDSAGITIMESF